MFPFSSVLLSSFLILAVAGQEDTKLDQLDVLQVKHILIDRYEGPLKYDTMNLFNNVEDLHLRHSNFVPFNTSFLLAVPKLKRMRMSSNDLTLADYNITGCCEKLDELEISTSGTKDLGKMELKMIKAMKSLKRLVLDSINFGDLEEDNFLSSNLTHLTITACALGKIHKNAFAKLENLEFLDLAWNVLDDFKKEVFAPLKNVQFINLKGNKLKKLTTDQIPPLPSLYHLAVSYNSIEEFNFEGIKNVAPNLKEVDLSGSQIKIRESGGVKIINHIYGIH